MEENEIITEKVYVKAKDVMERYKITRNTLSNWVKKGLIEYEVTPTGRYVYLIAVPKNTTPN
jgi:predicted site-specific integrase-resolvase